MIKLPFQTWTRLGFTLRPSNRSHRQSNYLPGCHRKKENLGDDRDVAIMAILADRGERGEKVSTKAWLSLPYSLPIWIQSIRACTFSRLGPNRELWSFACRYKLQNYVCRIKYGGRASSISQYILSYIIFRAMTCTLYFRFPDSRWYFQELFTRGSVP